MRERSSIMANNIVANNIVANNIVANNIVANKKRGHVPDKGRGPALLPSQD